MARSFIPPWNDETPGSTSKRDWAKLKKADSFVGRSYRGASDVFVLFFGHFITASWPTRCGFSLILDLFPLKKASLLFATAITGEVRFPHHSEKSKVRSGLLILTLSRKSQFRECPSSSINFPVVIIDPRSCFTWMSF